jgi:hypothetical protein
MVLTTIEDVVATVAGRAYTVPLSIEEDGLVVGPFGKVPWAGAQMAVEVGTEACAIHVVSGSGVESHYYLPVASFARVGGAGVVKTFAALLARSAAAAGARVAQPATA